MESDDPPPGGSWTLEAANQILPDVIRHTERVRPVYDRLLEKRDGSAAKSVERSEAEQGMRRCLGQWVREMEALGVRVLGLWRVEFVSENGAFPWQWPEKTLRSFREGSDEDESGESILIH